MNFVELANYGVGVFAISCMVYVISQLVNIIKNHITKQTIQRVYEDNIKFFGTLTCVYCFQSIPFGIDTLDHRVPLSRGGLNNYENLVVACKYCNSSKGNRTWKEYFWRRK